MPDGTEPTLDKLNVRLLNDLNKSLGAFNTRLGSIERLLQGDIDNEDSGGLKKTVRDIKRFLDVVEKHEEDILGAAATYRTWRKFRYLFYTGLLGLLFKVGYDILKILLDLAAKGLGS